MRKKEDPLIYCRYASESTGTNITCSGTYAVLIDGCLIVLEVA